MVAEVTLTPPPTIGESKVAVAAAPTCFGFENVTIGGSTNPPPEFDNVTIPTPPISVRDIDAAAPEPVLSVVLKVTDGVTVYPAPGFVTSTLWTDWSLGFEFRLQTWIPPIIDAIPTAVNPPAGAEDIWTVGTIPYPPPLLVTVNFLTPPITIPETAAALTASPTIVSVWVTPWMVLIPSSVSPSDSSPSNSLSISSIPVAMTSSW